MATVENHLIELLPRKDRGRLLAICEPVQLVLAEVLSEPGKPTRHVYFPTDGFISLVALTDGQHGLSRARKGFICTLSNRRDVPDALQTGQCDIAR